MTLVTVAIAVLVAAQAGKAGQAANPPAQAAPNAADSAQIAAIVKDLQSRMRPEDVALLNRVNDVIVANRVASLTNH
jgi:hypothetical protein